MNQTGKYDQQISGFKYLPFSHCRTRGCLIKKTSEIWNRDDYSGYTKHFHNYQWEVLKSSQPGKSFPSQNSDVCSFRQVLVNAPDREIFDTLSNRVFILYALPSLDIVFRWTVEILNQRLALLKVIDQHIFSGDLSF